MAANALSKPFVASASVCAPSHLSLFAIPYQCGEELFWQLKGDMVLEVMEKGRPKSIPIKEGEMFLLPPLIPHSPQRPADTIGFVMERERLASESDAMRWCVCVQCTSCPPQRPLGSPTVPSRYVDGTTDVLLQKVFHCHDLGTELPPIIKEYKESEEFRTGVPSGAPIPEFPHPVDVTSELPAPVNFEAWVADHRDVNAYIFGGPDTTAEYAVLVVTKGLVWDEWHHNPGETWFYVKAGGGAELTLRDRDGAEKPVALRETDSLLLPHGWSYKGSVRSRLLLRLCPFTCSNMPRVVFVLQWGAGVGLVVTNKVL